MGSSLAAGVQRAGMSSLRKPSLCPYTLLFTQVKMEEQLGLPSLPFMKGSDDMSLAKGEIGFISFVIKPWYTQFANAFPDFTFLVDRIGQSLCHYSHHTTHMQHVDKNVKNWKSVIEALEVATAREQ